MSNKPNLLYQTAWFCLSNLENIHQGKQSMKSCNDEVIAVLEVKGKDWNLRRTFKYDTHFVGLDTYLIHKDKYCKPIVIVTESPHIEEFKVSNLNDLTSNKPVSARPVNGRTGLNIIKFLVELLKNEDLLTESGSYPVIVINALQEQCSEGNTDTNIHRTKNFIKLWPERKHFLQERLITLTPTLVINACTMGNFYIDENLDAYSDGGRDKFGAYFLQLVKDEIGYIQCYDTSVKCEDDIGIIGQADLSGMVMHIILEVYDYQYFIKKQRTHHHGHMIKTNI
ncbi:hypothetical protein [Aeromonas molluscorum]|nr:hypothetical protein [Aeromonas molluscorum]